MINVHPALLPAFPGWGRSSRRSTTGSRCSGSRCTSSTSGVDTRAGDPAAGDRAAGRARRRRGARAAAPDRARAAAGGGAPDRPRRGPLRPGQPARVSSIERVESGVMERGHRARPVAAPSQARFRSRRRCCRCPTRPGSSSSLAGWPSSGSRSSRPAAPPGALSRRRRPGPPDLRPDRLPRDHGRARQDAPPEALRRPARASAIDPGPHAGGRGARRRVRRPRVREPVPVRADRRPRAA